MTDQDNDDTFAEVQTLYHKMHSVMLACEKLVRRDRGGVPYKTVAHDDVTAMIRPIMLTYGLLAFPAKISMEQDGNRTQIQMTVRIQNVDNAADSLDIPTVGFGVDKGDKGPGKAISYAFKYALLKAFMLETGDDPDLGKSDDHTTASQEPNF